MTANDRHRPDDGQAVAPPPTIWETEETRNMYTKQKIFKRSLVNKVYFDELRVDDAEKQRENFRGNATKNRINQEGGSAGSEVSSGVMPRGWECRV